MQGRVNRGIPIRLMVGLEYLKQAFNESDDTVVNVAITVQEKAIAFPTDVLLFHKARCSLVREAKGMNIELRQSYHHVGKWALIQ